MLGGRGRGDCRLESPPRMASRPLHRPRRVPAEYGCVEQLSFGEPLDDDGSSLLLANNTNSSSDATATDDGSLQPLALPEEVLGYIGAVTTVAQALGALFYRLCLKRFTLRRLFLVIVVASSLLQLTQLILITRANVAMGLPDVAFAIGDDAIIEVSRELLRHADDGDDGRIVPEQGGLNHVFAPLTSVQMAGQTPSASLSSGLTGALGIKLEDYRRECGCSLCFAQLCGCHHGLPHLASCRRATRGRWSSRAPPSGQRPPSRDDATGCRVVRAADGCADAARSGARGRGGTTACGGCAAKCRKTEATQAHPSGHAAAVHAHRGLALVVAVQDVFELVRSLEQTRRGASSSGRYSQQNSTYELAAVGAGTKLSASNLT